MSRGTVVIISVKWRQLRLTMGQGRPTVRWKHGACSVQTLALGIALERDQVRMWRGGRNRDEKLS